MREPGSCEYIHCAGPHDASPRHSGLHQDDFDARFCSRPSGVVFGAIGWLSGLALAVRRVGSLTFCARILLHRPQL